MPTLRTLREVDAAYAIDGPNHNALRQEIAAPAADLFRCLEDAAAWREWLAIEVEWTSDRPFGVGTTRTVTTAGQRIDEVFLVWDEGHRMAFRFARTTLPLAAFAEDYVIEARGPDACELVWNYAYEWGGPAPAVFNRLFGWIFAGKSRRSLRKLAALMADSGRRFAA